MPSTEVKNTNLDNIIQQFFNSIARNIQFILFCFILCMIYIWNNHMAQLLVTDINKKAKNLKELRWDYLTIKADLMYRSKLTEILPRAQGLGLEEIATPPYKLPIKEKEYQRQD